MNYYHSLIIIINGRYIIYCCEYSSSDTDRKITNKQTVSVCEYAINDKYGIYTLHLRCQKQKISDIDTKLTRETNHQPSTILSLFRKDISEIELRS